jgi:DNA-binding CsgD family transcriptional regulator
MGIYSKLTDIQVQQIISLYGSGKTVIEVSKELGISRHAVRDHLHKSDVYYAELNLEQAKKAIELYRDGVLYVNIALALGISINLIKNNISKITSNEDKCLRLKRIAARVRKELLKNNPEFKARCHMKNNIRQRRQRKTDPIKKAKWRALCSRYSQSSPEIFLRIIWKSVPNPGQRNGRHSHKKLINTEYLIGLYKKQNGLCALTGIPMLHHFKSPMSISIDRINSDGEYEPGNVQLVCQFINLGKKNHTNATIIDFLNKIKSTIPGTPDNQPPLPHIQELSEPYC